MICGEELGCCKKSGKRRWTFLRDIQDGFSEKVRNEALKYKQKFATQKREKGAQRGRSVCEKVKRL